MPRRRFYPSHRNPARSTDPAAAERAALYERNRQIVAGGVCPNCQTRLKRNSSIAGWSQCQASIEEQFRDADLRGRQLPRCTFQCFTE